MSAEAAILSASMLIGLAFAMARWEWRLYRAFRLGEIAAIPYSALRLFRRMSGILVLSLLALTIAAIGLMPPQNAQGLWIYISASLGLCSTLFLLALWDMIATARGPILAFPHKDDPYFNL